MKKKLEVVIRLNEVEAFAKYTSPDYNKVVVANVFDKFWGPCEVADMMIKRFLDEGENNVKCDFICADKELTGELFIKHSLNSKPKYFLLHVNLIFYF